MNTLDFETLLETLHPFEHECLKVMKQSTLTKINTHQLAELSNKLDLNKSNRAVNWLKEKEIFSVSREEIHFIQLSNSGEAVKKKGFPEKRLLSWINDNSTSFTIKEVNSNSGLGKNEFGAAFGILRREQLIEINRGLVEIGQKGSELLAKQDLSLNEQIINDIASNSFILNSESKNAVLNLIKRGLLEEKLEKTIITGTLTELGQKLLTVFDESTIYVDNLSAEMIANGEWKNVTFRPYRVDAPVPPVLAGKRHFYWQAIDYCRQIWLSLGFKEMEGTIVQTSFWNFDALFVPQDHPAREEHDTFFIKQPKAGKINNEILQKIASVHENGGSTGSKGWGGTFSREISESLVLRTHTTCLSSQTIYNLRKIGYPAKYFAVGRCFRNENIDWNHLAEFDQVEGIVVDPDVTFQDLLGYLKIFFKAMGFPKARFIPSYYPYTEPSVGIDVFHPIKKEWFDIGGAGVFRPELIEPLLGEDIPVLAWGPGIGRIIKETYNITDIRRQYENDIDLLRKAPIWMR